MNSPPDAKTKQLIIAALGFYGEQIEDTAAMDFTASISKSNLLFEIATATEWMRGTKSREEEIEEGFTV